MVKIEVVTTGLSLLQLIMTTRLSQPQSVAGVIGDGADWELGITITIAMVMVMLLIGT